MTSVPVDPLPQASADVQALLKHNAFRGYQLACVAIPPLFISYSLVRRRPLSTNKVLSATLVGGAAGAGVGLGIGTMQYSHAPGDRLTTARVKLAYDTKQIRLDDYATLGAILGAVLTPAIFYRRTRLVWSVFGGASMGVGTGTVVHYLKIWQESKEAQEARKARDAVVV